GYPMDGVVLTIGCDKTTPALLMAAATVNIPAIALSVGPMLNGWWNGERAGSGTVIWKARELMAEGKIDGEEFLEIAASSAPSVGYCNTMGTATTMNSLAEALGMQLPGSAAIPAPYRERGQMAYETGKRIVEMVWEDLRPADIMTRAAFENAIVVNSAIGGSTNAPIHLNGIARHLGVSLDNDDWQALGHHVPLLVNLQPAGKYLGEDYQQAGGVPAVVGELIAAGLLPHPGALTANGKTMGENCEAQRTKNEDVILKVAAPLVAEAGFINLKGNLFDSAIMKTSVISPEFRERYLSDPADPMAFEGRAVVFDGPEDFHHRIDDPSEAIDEHCILFMRGAGPKGYPGGAEVVNMRAPSYLLKKGITALPCIGDGRQSGTSGSPSILNAAPEAADNGGLAILRTGDRVRIDLKACTADMLVDDDELRARHCALMEAGGYAYPDSQTPWQALFREKVDRFDRGMTLKGADSFRDVSRKGLPRDNH
ncbi:MAG: IlvD/Edd family dehydratase, partial [Pseudomonadota bacterium]